MQRQRSFLKGVLLVADGPELTYAYQYVEKQDRVNTA